MPRQNKDEAKKYTRLNDKQHILDRPGMYIGSTKLTKETRWLIKKGKMVEKKVECCPGFEKIFDELIVNVLDHYKKMCLQKDKSPVTSIDVEIDCEAGLIIVKNNGKGIPIVESNEVNESHKYIDHKAKKVKLLIPELIFGEFRAGDTFESDKKKKNRRITGGMNGYGAKLTNVFSKFFSVETVDADSKEKFYQEYYDNMDTRTKPKIESSYSKPYTKISYKPDFEKFGLDKITKNIYRVLAKRVYDMAACTDKSVRVTLNGEPILVKSFSDYVDLYTNKSEKVHFLLENKEKAIELTRLIPNWELCVVIHDGERNVSFVNGIYTREGTHVNYVFEKLAKAVSDELNKKGKGSNVTTSIVKKHIWIFLNTIVVNPEFDSQTKDTLNTPSKDFGFKCDIDDKIVKKVLKLKDSDDRTLSDVIMSMYNMKELNTLSKVGTKKRLCIPKLDDASDAGTKRSDGTTLILTEGDSAKALAVAGASVADPDGKKIGIFPLRGKMLNVREATPYQLLNNKEVVNVMQILGLEVGKVYDFEKTRPRYQFIDVMTDQDLDGFHIKGLIANFIHYFWPDLLKGKIGFYRCIATPIVKVTKGKKSESFYNLNDFHNWLEKNDKKGWTIKYYKGLGTSTSTEAKEYFKDLDKNRITYKWKNNEKCNESMLLAFRGGKQAAQERKEWLADYDASDVPNFGKKTLKFQDLIHKELKHFSNADNIRSIPSVVDGCKPAHRKILFGCFKRNLVKDVKVSQLAGYISENADYHHGEVSLHETIIKMAQNFVGSNNINLLVPQGMFGTRLVGGKDSASPRYIYTRLAEETKKIFNEHDMKILKYKEDEGVSIEPQWYVPSLPMILINGTSGIGTGWSTDVPCYNPKDCIKNIKRLIKGKEPKKMHPWYRGFKGTIEEEEGGRYICKGVYKKLGSNLIEITELPIGVWTTKAKEYYESLTSDAPTVPTKRQSPKAQSRATKAKAKAKSAKDKKSEAILDSVTKFPLDEEVKIQLFFKPGELMDLEDKGTEELEKKLKLRTSFTTTNMVLFNPEGKIQRYETPEDILKDYFKVRIDHYEKRKEYLTKKYEKEVSYLAAKVRFIELYLDGTIKLAKVKTSKVYEQLDELKFPKFKNRNVESSESEEDNTEKGNENGNYDYLVRMPLISLSKEKMKDLEEELNKNKEALETINGKTKYNLWEDDLEVLEKVL